MLVSTIKGLMAKKGTPQDVSLAERTERNIWSMKSMLEELAEATSLESRGVALDREACDLRDLLAGVVDRIDDARARRSR